MPAPEKSGLNQTTRGPVGIIAGAGVLPSALATACQKSGRGTAIVALKGFADRSSLSGFPVLTLSIGQGRKMIRFFRDHHVRDIVLIGAVRRPSLFDVRPDWWTLSRLGPVLLRGAVGDDGLLRAVRGVFEAEGFQICGVHDFLPDLLARPGALSACSPSPDAAQDMARGFSVAQALGQVDVGQSVVVQQGVVLGVEAAEGTAALIERCGMLKRSGPGPILIKSVKPGQDRALDLPTIGPDTVRAAIAAGFQGISVQAGSTLMVDPGEMSRLADAGGLFVWAQ